MEFESFGEMATITFDMAALEAMARACRAAVACGTAGYAFDVAAGAFTAAALIARTHGDMSEGMREWMAQSHKRITTD